ncbi:MAG TPA: DUF4386 domain-containing protein [Aggregatilineales bacterium]|nr:DUF4386 domain-containing protein [Aggregatilineales bacterium]
MTSLSPSAALSASPYTAAVRPEAHMTVSPRKLAVITGVCFLITHVTAIGAPALNGLALNSTASSTGTDTQLVLAALLEVILALAVVGTAVALYPVARRWNEGAALGYVGLRTLEAGVIAVGVVPLLSLVTLRQSTAGAVDAGATTVLSDMLVMFYKWTLLIGPGLVCATNTVVMAYVLFSSRLVPRFIPVLGLIGGPLIFIMTVARMLDGYSQLPAWAALAVLPIFAWEVSLALWLITKGFRQPALASLTAVAPV